MGKALVHVEGLRGLAIMGIVLFHLFPEVFPLGYLGVEVFLVICGYFLFGKPFCKEGEGMLAAGRRFIFKKAARLWVPLAVLVLGGLVVCFFCVTPEDYAQGAETAMAALAGGSNIYLKSIQSGYFAEDTAFNPFVHTWYLSIVIQVFLLYLAGNFICHRVPRKGVIVLLVVVAALSFLYGNIGSIRKLLHGWGMVAPLWESPGYYSTCGRLWQVLAGAAIPFLPEIRKPLLLKIAGLLPLLVLAGLVFLPVHLLYKVLRTVVVVCTMCCIRYGAAGFSGRFLAWPALCKAGTYSFSLYLVHYPLISCYKGLPQFAGPAAMAVLLVCIGVATWLFYRYVEVRPCSGRTGWLLWGGGMAAAYAASFSPNAFLWRESDVQRYDAGVWYRPASAALHTGYKAEEFTPIHYIEKIQGLEKEGEETLLLMGAEGEPQFVLIGDSHGAAMFPAIDDFAKRHGKAGVYVMSYIIPFHDWRQDPQNVKGRWDPQKEQALLEWLAAHPELQTVIIAQRWDLRVEDASRCLAGGVPAMKGSLRAFVTMITGMGKKVILISHAPELPSSGVLRNHRFNVRCGGESPYADSLVCSYDDYQGKEGYYHVVLGECNAHLDRLEKEGLCHVLHIERSLFPGGRDLQAVEGDSLIMFDNNHLAPHGALKALQGCEADLSEWMSEAPPAAKH